MKITSRIFTYINHHTYNFGVEMLKLKQPRPSRNLSLSSFSIQFIFTENSCLGIFCGFSQTFPK